MPPARKWTRLEDLAVLHLYRGKVAYDSREVTALAAALERSPKSVAARITAFAGLDARNAAAPSARPTALSRAVWQEYQADRTAIATEGQRALPGHTEPLFHGPAVTGRPQRSGSRPPGYTSTPNRIWCRFPVGCGPGRGSKTLAARRGGVWMSVHSTPMFCSSSRAAAMSSTSKAV